MISIANNIDVGIGHEMRRICESTARKGEYKNSSLYVTTARGANNLREIKQLPHLLLIYDRAKVPRALLKRILDGSDVSNVSEYRGMIRLIAFAKSSQSLFV